MNGRVVTVGDIAIGGKEPLVLIAGPCQLESLDHARMMAERIAQACAPTETQFIFKASYDKANRTSHTGRRGLGIDAGLEILARIRAEFGCPVLTDVHEPAQCAPAAKAVDVLQIPAMLCRQTDLLLAAGETGAAINIKKGQFLAPWDMAHVAAKVASTGNDRILLTERGASFGYNMLVSDMRALPIMAETGYPVVFDATHSVQLPGGPRRRVGRATPLCRPPSPARLARWASRRSSLRRMKIPTTRQAMAPTWCRCMSWAPSSPTSARMMR
jgi:2-dehydro-3-deoxyphosphooctonate aldolase (KDO 8-P synthase)